MKTQLDTPASLKAWRAKKKKTQEASARAAGVDLRTWQRWEGGETPVPHWLPAVLARNGAKS